jgi:hypothetical protein
MAGHRIIQFNPILHLIQQQMIDLCNRFIDINNVVPTFGLINWRANFNFQLLPADKRLYCIINILK